MEDQHKKIWIKTFTIGFFVMLIYFISSLLLEFFMYHGRFPTRINYFGLIFGFFKTVLIYTLVCTIISSILVHRKTSPVQKTHSKKGIFIILFLIFISLSVIAIFQDLEFIYFLILGISPILILYLIALFIGKTSQKLILSSFIPAILSLLVYIFSIYVGTKPGASMGEGFAVIFFFWPFAGIMAILTLVLIILGFLKE